jgi:hypothetical protein
MVPRVGDTVRINPDGGRHHNACGRKQVMGDRKGIVTNVAPPDMDGDCHVTLEFADGTSMAVFISFFDGRFWKDPRGSAPFFLIEGVVPAGPEPRNNDGRETCWWCGRNDGKVVHTQKRGGGAYDVCPNCQR